MKRQVETSQYIQIYEQIREDIIQGIYAYGSKLPSKRLIAEERGVSVITAEHAYALLLEEGYIEARERSGYFVTFREEDGFAGQEIHRKKKVMTAAKNVPQQTEYPFPFSVLSKTMRRVLSDYGETLLIRSPNEGIAELRTEISRYLARSRGITAFPEQIIIDRNICIISSSAYWEESTVMAWRHLLIRSSRMSIRSQAQSMNLCLWKQTASAVKF